MFGSIFCWGTALALLFTTSKDVTDLYTRCCFAMGFIFLGILSRAVSVYHDTHMKQDDVKETTQNT